MKKIVEYSKKDLSQKVSDEDKLMDNLVDIRVNDIAVMQDAEKDVSGLKLKETDEEGKFAI